MLGEAQRDGAAVEDRRHQLVLRDAVQQGVVVRAPRREHPVPRPHEGGEDLVQVQFASPRQMNWGTNLRRVEVVGNLLLKLNQLFNRDHTVALQCPPVLIQDIVLLQTPNRFARTVPADLLARIILTLAHVSLAPG